LIFILMYRDIAVFESTGVYNNYNINRMRARDVIHHTAPHGRGRAMAHATAASAGVGSRPQLWRYAVFDSVL
jgi:hypothetical protein